jgi:hypothetical protein
MNEGALERGKVRGQKEKERTCEGTNHEGKRTVRENKYGGPLRNIDKERERKDMKIKRKKIMTGKRKGYKRAREKKKARKKGEKTCKTSEYKFYKRKHKKGT